MLTIKSASNNVLVSLRKETNFSNKAKNLFANNRKLFDTFSNDFIDGIPSLFPHINRLVSPKSTNKIFDKALANTKHSSSSVKSKSDF